MAGGDVDFVGAKRSLARSGNIACSWTSSAYSTIQPIAGVVGHSVPT